jgi:hypothetical protein
MQNNNTKNEVLIGESDSTAGLGAIIFGNTRFIEAEPRGNEPPNYACEGCAFLGSASFCGKAIDGLAQDAFGGDCDTRDVIYVKAPNV